MTIQKRCHVFPALLPLALTSALLVSGQQPQQHDPPAQKQTDEMNMRGDKAMGFDHLKTTHHFLLANDGGSIQVEANDLKDTESRDQIRRHLQHIAMMFSEGNFSIPMLVHDKTPPGSERMQQLKAEISYKYRETERGALIRISTANQEALRAIHEFLRFQIKEHMTGDPLAVPQPQ